MLTSLMCFQCGWKQPRKRKQIKVKRRWSWHYDRSHRILQTFPVLKAYQCPQSHIHCSINCSEFSPMSVRTITHSSIQAQLFSVGVTVIVRSLHILTSLLWLQSVRNFVFWYIWLWKSLYQNRRKNSCLFLFNAANQRVTMKSRAQSLSFSSLWITSDSHIVEKSSADAASPFTEHRVRRDAGVQQPSVNLALTCKGKWKLPHWPL